MEANRSIRHRESIVTSELDVEVTAEANRIIEENLLMCQSIHFNSCLRLFLNLSVKAFAYYLARQLRSGDERPADAVGPG